MKYIDTQLFINHKVDNDCEVENINFDAESNKMIKHLTNLVELNYINIENSSLTLTKSGHDYFMRKCNINNSSNFRYNSLAPMEIQQIIFETFFKNKPSVNTVEKFIKNNL
jgi:hypothetical protein